jgi:hypothetical protein
VAFIPVSSAAFGTSIISGEHGPTHDRTLRGKKSNIVWVWGKYLFVLGVAVVLRQIPIHSIAIHICFMYLGLKYTNNNSEVGSFSVSFSGGLGK